MSITLFPVISIFITAAFILLIILNRRLRAKWWNNSAKDDVISFIDDFPLIDLEEDEIVPRRAKKTKFVLPFFKRLPSKLGVDYRTFWILCAEYFFALYFLAVYWFDEPKALVPALFVVSLLNAFTPIAHVKSSEILERFYIPISQVVKCDKKEFYKWFKKEMEILYYSKQNLACSITGAILFGISTYLILGFPYKSRVANITLFINSILIGLLGGPLYRFTIVSAIFVLKLARFPIRIYIYNHPSASVKLIGRLLLNFAMFYATPAYSMCVVIAILVSPLKLTQMIWIIAGALIVLLYFFVPQWGLHKAMYAHKQNLMHKVSVAADKVIHEWTSNPMPETLAQFTKLCELEERIAKMDEWPFNAAWLASLLTTLIIPMLLAILQLTLKLVLTPSN